MKTLLTLTALALAAACGPAKPAMSEIRDLRVEIPAPDPKFLDFVTPEQVIQPGEDKFFCTDIVYDGPDVAVTGMTFMQGKFGHHIFPLSKKKGSEVRENYECTLMTDLDPWSIPLPEVYAAGYGTFLQKGKIFALQMHYVNTGNQPIRVRDVLRMQKTGVNDVKGWTSAIETINYDINIPPKKMGAEMVFDCKLEEEVTVGAWLGHMHENGTRIKLEIGPDAENLKTVYEVAAWKPEFRDLPPLGVHVSNPMKLAKGSLLRTTCVWNNETDATIKYPGEMCIAIGAVLGKKEPIICAIGDPNKK